MKGSTRPKVGVLALTLELYETLAPGLRLSRERWLRAEILPALEAGHEVLFAGAAFRKAAIESAVAEYARAGADALLVILLTYAPSQVALSVLQRSGLPVVIWNTQEVSAIDSKFTAALMIENHGVHGTQDLANVLVRAGVPFHYVTSAPNDPTGLEELGDFFRAAMAAARLRQARLGCIGYPFPGMGDIAVDTTQLAATLGCHRTEIAVEDYIRRAAGAAADEVDELVGLYRSAYAVGADVSEADLARTARSELAMRGLVTDHGLDAWTYQFLALGEDERTETLPFVAASRLMADGIGFAGEGDLVGAAGTVLLHWLQPPATFSEMFTIDFTGDAVFFSHMGEANVAMARRGGKVPLVARPTPITRTRGGQLALVTSLQPGPATLAALTLGPAGRWRIVAARIEIEDFGPLPGFCVPHFKARIPGGVNRFLTAYAAAGGPHHNAVCFGDARRRLEMAAGLIGGDYFAV